MTDSQAPAAALVSVVTPCYNAAAFVAQTIESVLGQDYPAVEMLVVDDGSSDGSWEVVQRFAPAVRAFRRDNGGPARARNYGASQARGRYLLFLDSDDLLSPDAISALVAAMDGAEEAIAACPWNRLVRRDGEWVRQPAEVPFPLPDADPLRAWLRGDWIAGCSLLWPRALFQELGGYDETLTADEDGDLMYRALVRGVPIRTTLQGESLYRSHGESRVSVAVDVHSEHRFRSRMRVFEKVEAELRAQGRWEHYRDSLGIAYHALAQRTFPSRPDLAREALRRGEAYAGRRAVAPTLPGRVLVGLLGMEGKERVVQMLARLGLMTRGRRELLARQRLHADHAPPAEVEP